MSGRLGGVGTAASEHAGRPIVDFLRALADPTRLRIVLALADGERSVAAVADELRLRRDRVSRQLGVLRHAGFVACRRSGGIVAYRLANADALAVCECMRAGLESVAAAAVRQRASRQEILPGAFGSR